MCKESSSPATVTLGHTEEVEVSVRAFDTEVNDVVPHFFRRCPILPNEISLEGNTDESIRFRNWRCSETLTKDTHHVFGIAASDQTDQYHFLEADSDSDESSNESDHACRQTKKVVRLSSAKSLPDGSRFNKRDKRLFVYRKSNQENKMYLEHAQCKGHISISDNKKIVLRSGSVETAAEAKIVCQGNQCS